MGHCIYHPGRNSTKNIGGREYCEQCEAGIEAAALLVDAHVEPKKCFVWYQKADTWAPIHGTGCAHWVLHNLDCKAGADVSPVHQCTEGFIVRIPDLLVRLQKISIEEIRENDVYVTADKSHVGLVSKIDSSFTELQKKSRFKKITDPPLLVRAGQIMIEHDSSGQHKVATNDFAVYFSGRGNFYRYGY